MYFTVYTPTPVVTAFEVRRGATASPEAALSYQQVVKVFATDAQGPADVASVTVTDSWGNQHDAWKVCDAPLAFCWQSWDEAQPTPPGTYTATVTDQEGNATISTAQVSTLPSDPGFLPVLETPAPNYSIATSVPTFSWDAPLGAGIHSARLNEVDGPCGMLCTGAVSSPFTYPGDPLLAGHLYRWMVWSFDNDTVSQTDPAAYSGFLWTTRGYFWVEPKFVGFLQPINDDGSSLFKLGATVPVKFQLLMADGTQLTTADCRLSVAKVESSVVGTYQEAVSPNVPDGGNAFRYVGGQYQFNLGTKALSKGTWRLQVSMDGTVVHETVISLR